MTGTYVTRADMQDYEEAALVECSECGGECYETWRDTNEADLCLTCWIALYGEPEEHWQPQNWPSEEGIRLGY